MASPQSKGDGHQHKLNERGQYKRITQHIEALCIRQNEFILPPPNAKLSHHFCWTGLVDPYALKRVLPKQLMQFWIDGPNMCIHEGFEYFHRSTNHYSTLYSKSLEPKVKAMIYEIQHEKPINGGKRKANWLNWTCILALYMYFVFRHYYLKVMGQNQLEQFQKEWDIAVKASYYCEDEATLLALIEFWEEIEAKATEGRSGSILWGKHRYLIPVNHRDSPILRRCQAHYLEHGSLDSLPSEVLSPIPLAYAAGNLGKKSRTDFDAQCVDYLQSDYFLEQTDHSQFVSLTQEKGERRVADKTFVRIVVPSLKRSAVSSSTTRSTLCDVDEESSGADSDIGVSDGADNGGGADWLFSLSTRPSDSAQRKSAVQTVPPLPPMGPQSLSTSPQRKRCRSANGPMHCSSLVHSQPSKSPSTHSNSLQPQSSSRRKRSNVANTTSKIARKHSKSQQRERSHRRRKSSCNRKDCEEEYFPESGSEFEEVMGPRTEPIDRSGLKRSCNRNVHCAADDSDRGVKERSNKKVAAKRRGRSNQFADDQKQSFNSRKSNAMEIDSDVGQSESRVLRKNPALPLRRNRSNRRKYREMDNEDGAERVNVQFNNLKIAVSKPTKKKRRLSLTLNNQMRSLQLNSKSVADDSDRFCSKVRPLQVAVPSKPSPNMMAMQSKHSKASKPSKGSKGPKAAPSIDIDLTDEKDDTALLDELRMAKSDQSKAAQELKAFNQRKLAKKMQVQGVNESIERTKREIEAESKAFTAARSRFVESETFLISSKEEFLAMEGRIKAIMRTAKMQCAAIKRDINKLQDKRNREKEMKRYRETVCRNKRSSLNAAQSRLTSLKSKLVILHADQASNYQDFLNHTQRLQESTKWVSDLEAKLNGKR